MLSNPDNETSEQKALFAWAALQQDKRLKWLHSIPNQNQHRLIAEGVRRGIADIFLPYPSDYEINHHFGVYHGLYIEMKIEKRRKEKNGGLSEEQIEFGKYAISIGYKWFVCYGWEEARDRIKEYLNV
jgi:hypothetical protein